MNNEDKLLDIDYINALMQEFKEVRSKTISYKVRHSDNMNSNSIYIEIYIQADMQVIHRQCTLRISDHLLHNCIHKQFIVNAKKKLTKKKRDNLKRTIQNIINDSLLRNVKLTIKNMDLQEDTPIISLDEFLEQFDVIKN